MLIKKTVLILAHKGPVTTSEIADISSLKLGDFHHITFKDSEKNVHNLRHSTSVYYKVMEVITVCTMVS